MKSPSRLLQSYRMLMLRISIFNRVLIGNSAIIIFGAIAGTLLTQKLALLGDIRLIFLFSFTGILITLLVNYVIIRSALEPMRELGRVLDNVSPEQIKIPTALEEYKDPDIQRLITAVNAMLARLSIRTGQLRAISGRAINAQEEERVRIARSLHDDTAQSISILIIHLERIEKLIPAGEGELLRKVTESHRVATQLLENLRNVIWDLRPSILDDLGLVSAIRWYARSNLANAGIDVNFASGNETLRLPNHLEIMLFRILQETVSNILRHANASKVSIDLHTEVGQVVMDVKDDGRGFDVQETGKEAVNRKQLGLLGIQERISLAGGQVKIESTPGQGTAVRVRVPLHIEDSDNIVGPLPLGLQGKNKSL